MANSMNGRVSNFQNNGKGGLPAGRAGFSLLELVIYIATASIALLGVITLFSVLGNSWVRVQARARVEEGARLAVERIKYEVEQSQGILVPIPGGTGDALVIDSGGISRNYSGQAWSESLGWIYFGCVTGAVDNAVDSCIQVNDILDNFQVTRSFDALSGFAVTEDNDGISMSCTDSPNSSSCLTGEYQVTADASGDYFGFAWGQDIGWLSFNCENTASCIGTGTTSNPCGGDSGAWRVCEVWNSSNNRYELYGWAWSNQTGWVSFNCENGDTEANCSAPVAPFDYGVISELAGSKLVFSVNAEGKLVAQEGSGVEQPLTDDDVLISYCDGETIYFRNIANPAPARAAAKLCFKATYRGAGTALTNYSTEVRTTFQLN